MPEESIPIPSDKLQYLTVTRTGDGTFMISFELDGVAYGAQAQKVPVLTRRQRIFVEAGCTPVIRELINRVLTENPTGNLKPFVLFMLRELRDNSQVRGDLLVHDYAARNTDLFQPLEHHRHIAQVVFPKVWAQVLTLLQSFGLVTVYGSRRPGDEYITLKPQVG